MKQLTKKQKKVLADNQIILAYLFGSVARGEEHIDSDVDVAVLFDDSVPEREYLQREGVILSALSGFYPKRELNLVNLNISSPLLRQSAFMDGQELYIRERDDEISFQLQSVREYEEYKHFANIYDQFLYKRISDL